MEQFNYLIYYLKRLIIGISIVILGAVLFLFGVGGGVPIYVKYQDPLLGWLLGWGDMVALGPAITFIIIGIGLFVAGWDYLYHEVYLSLRDLLKSIKEREKEREKALAVIYGDPKKATDILRKTDIQEVWDACAKLGEPVVEPLIQLLKDGHWWVRWRAAEALGKIKDARAVEPLIQALKDKDEYVRERAAEALEKMKWTPKDDTENVYYLIAKRKWNKVAKIGKPAVEPLIQALKYVPQEAVGALREIGKPAVEPLIQALKDEDSGVRAGAAKALGKIGWIPKDDTENAYYLIAKREWGEVAKIGKPAVEPLIQALKDENSGVRAGAAEALGEIGDARAVEPLIQALKDKDSHVRERAAKALGKMKWTPKDDTENVYYLIAKEEWYEVAKIGKPAVEPLIQALKDECKYVRAGAATALGKIGDAGAVEPLIQALKDEDIYVRERAAEALKKIGSYF